MARSFVEQVADGAASWPVADAKLQIGVAEASLGGASRIPDVSRFDAVGGGLHALIPILRQ
jgi:hypothetical protein